MSEFTRLYKTLRGARVAAAKFKSNGARRANVFRTMHKTKSGAIDQRYKSADCFAVYVMR